MTVAELKEILEEIPDDFDIAMDGGDGSLVPICHTDSGVVHVEFNDTKEKIFIFVLCPCYCTPHESEETLN